VADGLEFNRDTALAVRVGLAAKVTRNEANRKSRAPNHHSSIRYTVTLEHRRRIRPPVDHRGEELGTLGSDFWQLLSEPQQYDLVLPTWASLGWLVNGGQGQSIRRTAARKANLTIFWLPLSPVEVRGCSGAFSDFTWKEQS
jgi:hypothetical protein